MTQKSPANRRRFLKGAAAVASAPFILPSKVWAEPPSEKLVMGFIGMGKQNGGLLGNFMGQKGTHAVAVCDVDTNRRTHAKKRVDEKNGNSDCKAHNDFRKIIEDKSIDAVCIATPDHWHANITLAALKSGKDVYCEKPLTHNIHEAISVMKAVDANKRVLQTGSMQRSSSEFRVACELVQNGAIGKLESVSCSFGDPGRPCDLPEEEMEPGLDWNMWVGPAKMRAYNSTLSPRGLHNHFPHWRNYKEFGGGMVTDWGAHHLDIAQWGLGMDASGPVEARPPAKQGDKRGASLVYASGVAVTHANGGPGVIFKGSEGEVQVGRGRISFARKGETIGKFMGREDGSMNVALKNCVDFMGEDRKVKLYNSNHHIRDFLSCVQERKSKPITNEQVGGRSAICCHLMNLAYWNHQQIKWDPAKLQLAGNSGDKKWLTRDYRSPWSV